MNNKIVCNIEQDLSIWESINKLVSLKSEHREEIKRILMYSISSLLRLSNTAWRKLDIKDILFKQDVPNYLKELFEGYCTFLWLWKMCFYVSKWDRFIEKSFQKWNTKFNLKSINRNNISKSNLAPFFNNKCEYISKCWFYITNKISNKWNKCFCIKVNDYVYLSWENNTTNVSIEDKVEIIISFASVLRTKYDKFLWHKDQLTWLILRQWFSNLINFYKEWSLIFFDIDHFKNINDTYWHSIWDNVLKKIWSILKNNIRSQDILCRYWWEEFIVFLPELWTEQSFNIAERIRKIVENTDFWFENNKITISAWISKYENWKLEESIHNADKKLYTSKQTWRNKTTI